MRPDPRLLLAVAALLAGCSTGPATAPTSATGASASPGTPAASPGTPTASSAPPTALEVPPLHPSVDDWEAGVVEVVPADGRARRVAVRIARTPEQRAHGLMEVPELPDGAGMWFAYDEDRTGGFWMKNTLVPLDITYVGADGDIVDVAEAVPCESDPCPTYPPATAYRNVLEVPAGFLDRIGAGVGDTVRLLAR